MASELPLGLLYKALERSLVCDMHERWDVLVVDLDGTLLCGRGQVSDKNRRSFEAVSTVGIEIVVATGRCFAECRHILDTIRHEGASIVAGGSQLCNDKGTAIVSDPLDEQIAREVAEQVLASDLRLLLLKDASKCKSQYVLVGDAPLHRASSWWFNSMDIPLLEVDTIEEDPWPQHTLRAGAVAEAQQLESAVGILVDQLQTRAKLQHWSAVTSSEATGSQTHLLEVFSASVNKWTMLQKHMGDHFDCRRIAAIGDGLNDVEVLQEAGLSIAMSNASSFVQSHADLISGHHNEDGFAEAMDKWILGNGLNSEQHA